MFPTRRRYVVRNPNQMVPFANALQAKSKRKEASKDKDKSDGKENDAEDDGDDNDEEENEFVEDDEVGDEEAEDDGDFEEGDAENDDEGEDEDQEEDGEDEKDANAGDKRKAKNQSNGTNKKQKGNAPPGKVGSKHMDDKEPAPRGSADRLPKKGQKIQWKAMPGFVDGKVTEILTSDKEVDGKSFKASKKVSISWGRWEIVLVAG